MPDANTRYDEGDEVATPDGPGVVAAVVTDDLEFPQDGDELTDVVGEDVDALGGLPEGWSRESVLEYWSSIGGTWEACVEDMADEIGEERASEHCSAMKDEVVRTTRWRTRF